MRKLGKDTAHEELKQLLARDASADQILNSQALRGASEHARSQAPTLQVGEQPSGDWWRRRTYNGGSTIETVVQNLRAKALSYAGGTAKAERRAVLLSGPPGAGKSLIGERMAQALHAALIDADDAKACIPEFDAGSGSSAVHHESGLISTIVLAESLRRGENVLLPKVSGVPSMAERLLRLIKRGGYELVVVHLSVSFDETVRRMARRYLKTGRVVDADYVRDVGTQSHDTFEWLKHCGAADGYVEIDAEEPCRQESKPPLGRVWPELATTLRNLAEGEGG